MSTSKVDKLIRKTAKTIGTESTKLSLFIDKLSTNYQIKESDKNRIRHWFETNYNHDDKTCKEDKQKGLVTSWGGMSYDHLNICQYYINEATAQSLNQRTNWFKIIIPIFLAGAVTVFFWQPISGWIYNSPVAVEKVDSVIANEVSSTSNALKEDDIGADKLDSNSIKENPIDGKNKTTDYRPTAKNTGKYTLGGNELLSLYNDSLTITMTSNPQNANPKVSFLINEIGGKENNLVTGIEIGNQISLNNNKILVIGSNKGQYANTYKIEINVKKNNFANK